MKVQYFDPLKSHPNFCAFGKTLAESKRLSNETFGAAFASSWAIPQDDLGVLDSKFGVGYWLRLLALGQYKWLTWVYDNGNAYCCWRIADETNEEFVLVNLSTAAWDMVKYPESDYQTFCKGNLDSCLKVIKGQPTQPMSPPRASPKETGVTQTPAAPKKSRKRPLPPPKEKEEQEAVAELSMEPEPKKLVV